MILAFKLVMTAGILIGAALMIRSFSPDKEEGFGLGLFIALVAFTGFSLL